MRALTWVSNLGVRAFGIEPRDELSDVHTVEELQLLVAASHEEGAIPDLSAELLSGVLDFAGGRAADVMVPRDSICAVPIDATVAEAEAVVRERAHTRVLVVGEAGLDEVVGFLHAKDLLSIDADSIDESLPQSLVRRNLTVGEDESLESLLLAMQRRHLHVAVVVGSDDSTVGLVTLDDLLECLVGDIADELGA